MVVRRPGRGGTQFPSAREEPGGQLPLAVARLGNNYPPIPVSALPGIPAGADTGSDQRPAVRISFLLANSSIPYEASSRPYPERLTPPNGSSAIVVPCSLM